MSSTPVDSNTKLRQKVKELEKQLDQYHDLFRFPLGTTGDFVDVNVPVSRLPVEEPLWRHLGPARPGRDLEEQFRCCGIVGNSRAMHGVYELIQRAAATDANVIVYGESGTGKELVAKAIHDMGDRSDKAFVPVHCGAVPATLLESEFFGFKKGAFTGADRDRPGFLDHAEKGTLFLDELGEIDLNLQVKLLRVIEGSGFTPVGGREVKPTDIRIIAATNRNLNDLVKQGRMREDFFYRIHIIPVYLPPLRERKEDIPLLARHFLKKYSKKKFLPSLPAGVAASLKRHDWPGNVRELENTLQRFLNLDVLDFLDSFSNTGLQDFKGHGETPHDLSLRRAVEQFEKRYIKQVLEKNQWNRKMTAEALGIGRKTLYLKMKTLGIETGHR